MRKIFILLSFLFFLPWKSGIAQIQYPSSQYLGLQSATLENVMLLQNLRDPWNDCIGRNSWTLGYGAGGYSRGKVQYSGTAGSGTQETDFQQKFGGTLLGTDVNIGTDARLGGFFAYNAASQTNETQEKTRGSHYLWGIYGKKEWAKTYFLGTSAIGYGYSKTNASDYNASSPLSIQSNAWRVFLYGEFGRNYRLGVVDLQPFGGLQYYYAGNGSSTAELEPQNLSANFSALKTNSLRNILGLRIGVPLLKMEKQTWNLNCVGFWFHEFLNYNNLGGSTIQYNSGETQIQQLIYSQQMAGRDWCILTPTLDWKCGNFHLWGGYIAMFNERETIQLGQGGIAYCW